jgi:hypothetical protein
MGWWLVHVACAFGIRFASTLSLSAKPNDTCSTYGYRPRPPLMQLPAAPASSAVLLLPLADAGWESRGLKQWRCWFAWRFNGDLRFFSTVFLVVNPAIRGDWSPPNPTCRSVADCYVLCEHYLSKLVFSLFVFSLTERFGGGGAAFFWALPALAPEPEQAGAQRKRPLLVIRNTTTVRVRRRLTAIIGNHACQAVTASMPNTSWPRVLAASSLSICTPEF